MEYKEFLEGKIKRNIESGIDVDEILLNKYLFPFQKFIVKRALRKGKYAVFADCGLGKTIMQLEWSRLVVETTDMPVIILAPLAVAGQTIKEGEKFGIEVIKWIDEFNSLHNIPAGIYITNYEQLEKITVIDDFAGVVLDESSILKNYEGSLKKLIIDVFSDTMYKLACTATPSPNDPMELGNHAEFLDVMSRNEMLAMYFVHDGGDTAKWRLKGHAIKQFYRFTGTWAVMLNKPHDIGFEMPGYYLPALNIVERQIITPKRNNGSLFNDAIISATNFNDELRITKSERLRCAADIVNNNKDENFIVWIKQNEEGELLKSLIPGAIEVKGSDSHDKEGFYDELVFAIRI